MRLRLLLLALTCTFLSACFESKSLLLDPAQARNPLQDQSWTQAGSGENADKPIQHTLKLASDGWYDYDEYHVLINDLGSRDGATLYIYGAPDGSEGAYVYGILAVWPNGAWRTTRPDCSVEAERAIGINAGAQAPEDVCMFDSAPALLQAMRTYSTTDEFWKRLNE